MLKGIALIAGAALLGLTAHATIGLTSGYGSPHADVTLGIAAATAIAAIALGSIWSARRGSAEVSWINCFGVPPTAPPSAYVGDAATTFLAGISSPLRRISSAKWGI